MKEELSCGQQPSVNHSLCSHSAPIWWLQFGAAESSTRFRGPLLRAVEPEEKDRNQIVAGGEGTEIVKRRGRGLSGCG